MCAGMATDEAAGYLASRSSHLGHMADAYTRVGQLEVSTALLNDALRAVEETDERFLGLGASAARDAQF